MKFSVKKSRTWIPALGFVIAFGFIHNCIVAPHVPSCKVIDWSNLIITLSTVLGLGGARDIALKKYTYFLGDVQKNKQGKAKGTSKLLDNKFWIPMVGWALVCGFFNNFVIVPYTNVPPVEYGGLLAATSILLTISGVRDYGIYATSKNDECDSTKEES